MYCLQFIEVGEWESNVEKLAVYAQHVDEYKESVSATENHRISLEIHSLKCF